MTDILDLRKSQKILSLVSEQYAKALREERDANIAYETSVHQIELDNMRALLSKDMTAAIHKIKVGHETFHERLRLYKAKINRKIFGTSLDSVKENHWTLKKELGLQ